MPVPSAEARATSVARHRARRRRGEDAFIMAVERLTERLMDRSNERLASDRVVLA